MNNLLIKISRFRFHIFIRRFQNFFKIRNAVKLWHRGKVSIISQNCIGGIFYHDMNQRFLSPTVNLFFHTPDFLKFLRNLQHYLSLTPIVEMDPKGYPVGKLDNIYIYFMHFESCDEAIEKWEERKKRILWDKIFVIVTAGIDFEKNHFEEFQCIPYPKILYTGNREWRNYPDVCYIKNFIDKRGSGNAIDKRTMYKSNKLVNKLNEVANG